MSKRYSRHTLLKEIGKEGQKLLSESTVAVIGCGGLGNIAAAYLAGAGIGHLILVDGDVPDVSNVHRQIFYSGNENNTKSKVLAEKLAVLNPEITYTIKEVRLSKKNCEDILSQADLVLECTDDPICKYLVNDYCVIENIPLVYGAIHKYEGYVSLFTNSDESQVHLRDVFPQPDLNIPTCSEVGVLNTIAGIIGMLQANEAIKYIVGFGTNLTGKLLTYNALTYDQFVLKISKTWMQDLEDIWETTEYTPLDCMNVMEIKWSDAQHNVSAFKWISLLPASEVSGITASTCYFSSLQKKEIADFAQDTPTIVYCRTGAMSRSLISSLLLEYPYLELYNLAGGYVQYQKEEILGSSPK